MKKLADEVAEGFEQTRQMGENVDNQFNITNEAVEDLEKRHESLEDQHKRLKEYTEKVEENLNSKIAEVDTRVDDVTENQLNPALRTVENVVERMDKSEASVQKSTEDFG